MINSLWTPPFFFSMLGYVYKKYIDFQYHFIYSIININLLFVWGISKNACYHELINEIGVYFYIYGILKFCC